MLTNKRTIRVQWGDCDPAGIVFYPRYFEWFDACTILLFEKATGMTKIKMLEKYGGAGLALLEARAVFKVASHYGEDIEIETEVTEFRRSSFFVQPHGHQGRRAGAGGLRDAAVDRARSGRSPSSNPAPMPAEISPPSSAAMMRRQRPTRMPTAAMVGAAPLPLN